MSVWEWSLWKDGSLIGTTPESYGVVLLAISGYAIMDRARQIATNTQAWMQSGRDRPQDQIESTLSHGLPADTGIVGRGGRG